MKQVTRCHFYFYFLIIGGRCRSGCQKCLGLSCCCTQYKCCYSNDIIILNDTWTIKMTVYVFIFITWKCILVLLWTNDTALLVLSRWLKAALVILWLWKQTVLCWSQGDANRLCNDPNKPEYLLSCKIYPTWAGPNGEYHNSLHWVSSYFFNLSTKETPHFFSSFPFSPQNTPLSPAVPAMSEMTLVLRL